VVRLAVELLLAPALIGFSTLAYRRWGAKIGGLISAFPAVVGPVLLISAQERGVVFVARAANGTMLGLAALGAFAVTYGWVALRARWWVSVALAWASAALLATLVGWSAGGGLRFPAGLCVAVISLALAYAAMPTTRASAGNDHRPRRPEKPVAVRMILTALLVAVLAETARLFDPLIAGILAALPILASVLAAFTHHHDGSQAVVQLLRGMLTGMAGFVGFCGVLAMLIVPAGPAAAFAVATIAAIVLQALAIALVPRPGLLRR
jgi:hypothetical protein